MHFFSHKNPIAYTSETHEYINDLQRVTLLRDKCQDATERGHYSQAIHAMQEVLIFINTITDKDKRRVGM